MRANWTIAVDVDDTVAELMDEWLIIYENLYGRGLKKEHITDWECSCIPTEHRKEFYAILHSQTLYDNVKPVKGALEGITELRNAGARIVFVTSAVQGHEGAKLRWLRWYGFLPERYAEPDYIECYDKSLIRADLIIDDKPDTCLAYPAYAILKETPANRTWENPDLTRIIRAKEWSWIVTIATSLRYY